jgi:hypothetical protein
MVDEINVVADSIDTIHIKYTCSKCWTSYKKDKTPRKGAKNIQHQHGSCGDSSNRIESRDSHCYNGNTLVHIHITDQTKRKH